MSWSSTTYLVWAVLGASFVAAEVVGRRRHRTAAIGEVVTALAVRTPLRVGLVLAWMWLGWHAFAR
jgi:hypothetical protein